MLPGETALAFYTACNPTDKPVTGISTYNVLPFEAGQYFNKIQCFCFEEQLLNPHEQVSDALELNLYEIIVGIYGKFRQLVTLINVVNCIILRPTLIIVINAVLSTIR